jgi:hypothetical protein
MTIDDTIALIDISELKVHLKIDESKDSEDDRFAALINAVSRRIINITDRLFIAPSAEYDDIFAGNNDVEIHLRHKPLTKAISTIYYWGGSAWADLNNNDFAQKNAEGILYFTDGSKFSLLAPNSYKVSYTYGYARSDVPPDLKFACAELCAWQYKKFSDDAHGVSSRSFGDQSVSYLFNSMAKDEHGIPPEIMSLIRPYVRFA